MQGGFSVNLAPKEFIGKLLNLFDSTAHRVVGGLPPPIPTVGGAVHGHENHYQSTGPRVSSSQSTMAMSSLVPQSMEPINEWAADNKKTMHTRSVSEPDFGRSPMQVSFNLPYVLFCLKRFVQICPMMLYVSRNNDMTSFHTFRVRLIQQKKQVLLAHRTKHQWQVVRLAWVVLALGLSYFRRLLV